MFKIVLLQKTKNKFYFLISYHILMLIFNIFPFKCLMYAFKLFIDYLDRIGDFCKNNQIIYFNQDTTKN